VIDKKSRKSKAEPASDAKAGDAKEERSRSSFKQRQPMRAQSVRKQGKAKAVWKPRVRDINEDVELPAPEAAPAPAPVPPKPGRPSLKVIPGGKS